MAKHFRDHADHIVKEFSGFLDAEAINAVGDEAMDQLTLLIESALSATVLQEMERVSDKVITLGTSIKNGAEHFED